MHEEKAGVSSETTYINALPNQNVNGIDLADLDVGDIMVDGQGLEWIVRQCFCGLVECSGKTFKQLEGKKDMDVWDRGRPMASCEHSL
jgi:hypothetical protein